MTKKPAKAPKTDTFIDALDKFAKDLMTEALSVKVVSQDGVDKEEQAHDLQAKLEVFRDLVRWQGVRNKLKEGPEETALDDLRSAIARSTDTRTGLGRHGPRSPRGSSLGPPSDFAPHPSGNGGSALDAIKNRLPRSDADDDDGDGDGAEC